MEENLQTEEFIVVDERVKPFTAIPKTGVLAIREGKLDTKELSVYFVMNMMLDGVICVAKGISYPYAIARFTGLTERQVTNAYKKLAQKGLLTIDGENVKVNE